jgi:hypothetical protein
MESVPKRWRVPDSGPWRTYAGFAETGTAGDDGHVPSAATPLARSPEISVAPLVIRS